MNERVVMGVRGPECITTFGGCMAKITGIGGVFFKSTGDHKKLSEWYASNLGLQLEDWGGAILKWSDDTANDEGLTVWNVAAPDTRWFQSGQEPLTSSLGAVSIGIRTSTFVPSPGRESTLTLPRMNRTRS